MDLNQLQRAPEETRSNFIAVTSESDLDNQSSSQDSVSSSGKKITIKVDVAAKSAPTSNEDWYNDYSDIKPEPEDETVALLIQKNIPQKDPTFPIKVHMILANPEFQGICSWLPHGRAFRIIHQKDFEEKVIPLYFRHGRLSSFARQVSGWGFRRIVNGSDFGAYYHDLFLRGMPHLCKRMRRLGTNDRARRRHDEKPSPDFYAMDKVKPLPLLDMPTVSSPRLYPKHERPHKSPQIPSVITSRFQNQNQRSSLDLSQRLAATAPPADSIGLSLALLENRREGLLRELLLTRHANDLALQSQMNRMPPAPPVPQGNLLEKLLLSRLLNDLQQPAIRAPAPDPTALLLAAAGLSGSVNPNEALLSELLRRRSSGI